MRAALLRAYGPPESLEIVELTDPRPKPGDVVIEIRAAAVNFPDVLIAANHYQVSAPLPLIPGSELAGVVRELGEGVTSFNLGDAVTSVEMTGAFAEQIAVPASHVARRAPELSFEEAASFGVVFRTAFTALRTVAQAKPGEWALVLGAAGGVGSAALEVAKRLGCRVLAIASSEAKLARDLADLGALVKEGLRPRIGRCFALADTAAAMRFVADRRAIGKVVIRP